jgi:hypothetical protein
MIGSLAWTKADGVLALELILETRTSTFTNPVADRGTFAMHHPGRPLTSAVGFPSRLRFRAPLRTGPLQGRQRCESPEWARQVPAIAEHLLGSGFQLQQA